MRKYTKLLDKTHKNEVVMSEGEKSYEYVHGRGWVRSSILLDYFCDESDTYDMYEEITEVEAMKLMAESQAS